MEDKHSSQFAAKWPEDVVSRGYAPIPKCLITCMSDLDLKAQEAVVLFNIIEKCWKAGDKAWPSVGYLATNVGRKDSATRAITSSLAKKGFLGKEQRYNDTNLYDLEPLAKKLALHMSKCRHTAKKSEGFSQKSGGRDSQKTSDYIEPVIKTNLDPLYSHIVNNDDDPDIEIISRKNILHPCETDSGVFKHDWDEPFDVYKGLNKSGEQVIWRYRECKRCQDKFHTKANPKNYRWEAGELINMVDYAKMDTV
jgi:hypothetical protein